MGIVILFNVLVILLNGKIKMFLKKFKTFVHKISPCASAFVPLPRWIQAKRAGTGDDCFKWAVLAGMHPVDDNVRRMDKYVKPVTKYDFSSLRFPFPLSSIGSFATSNNLSINVYIIEDGKKVIYPLCVSQIVVPDRHVDLLLYECNSIPALYYH